MRTRRLGDSGEVLTVIGLGTWAIGGGGWAYGWGPQEDRESISAIHRALDLGINWIDTAPVYGLGHAEEVVGRALKEVGKPVFIASKCGLQWNRKGKIKGSLGVEIVRREVEESLGRLGVDRIDLLQIHWPTRERDDLEAWEAMAALVREGKVRHIGVSNFDVALLEKIRAVFPPASLQPPYSMLERAAEQELLPYCADHGVGVIAYSPMQCGLLSGRFTRERIAALPRDDFRRKDRHFKEPLLRANLELVKGLQQIASDAGRTPAQLAIAWVLRRPEVTAAIVGARSPGQIGETADAADWVLSPEELERVDSLLQARDERSPP